MSDEFDPGAENEEQRNSREMSENDFQKAIFRNSRMEAICKCAAMLMEENRRDLARDVLKAMKVDQARLLGLKKMFAAVPEGATAEFFTIIF